MANLEQSGSRIPEAQPVKLIFSLIATFYLTKTENKTKKSLIQLSHYSFEKFIVFETTYVCVLTQQISIFQHNSNKFQTVGGRRGGGGIILPLSYVTPKRTLKKSTQIRVKKQANFYLILLFLNVCKQTFHISHRCISQNVKSVLV